MKEMSNETKKIIKEIRNILKNEIVELSNALKNPISEHDYTIDCEHLHEKPTTKLNKGESAVYIFIYKGKPEKIGRVCDGSNNRYINQHYLVNGNKSTVAKTLKNKYKLTGDIGEWMLDNLERINIVFHKDSRFLAPMVEAILHFKYNPTDEGRK